MRLWLAAALLLGLAGSANAATTNFVAPVQPYTCAAHTWAETLASATGATACTQPAYSDITGVDPSIGYVYNSSGLGELFGVNNDSIANGISGAGTTQSGATALTAQQNVISTCASGAGVALMKAVFGGHSVIENNGAAPCYLYPFNASGATINGGAANAAIQIGVNQFVYCWSPTGLSWYCK
jgi:hypothetical protein